MPFTERHNMSRQRCIYQTIQRLNKLVCQQVNARNSMGDHIKK